MSNAVPLDMLEAHTLVVGTTGSGKTYLTRGLVEELRRADRRVAAIDKMGNLWGVTASADGKQAGLEFVIFGGKRAHVPMAPGDGAKLGRLFAERGFPAIFDVSQWGRDDQELWVADFADALFMANELSTHLVLDEAQSWVPQGGGGPAFRAVLRLAEQGRGNGIHLLMAVQRLSRIDKTAASMAQGLIAMRQTGLIDRKAVRDLVSGQADKVARLFEELPELPTGTGWVWNPLAGTLERAKFAANATFDSSRTPRHGDTVPAPIAVSGALVDELRKALAPAASADDHDRRFNQVIAEIDPDALVRRDRRIEELETEISALKQGATHHQRRLASTIAAVDASINDLQALRRRLERDLPPTPDSDASADGDLTSLATAILEAGPGMRIVAASDDLSTEGPPMPATPAPASAPDREYRALRVLAAVSPLALTEAAWAARAGYSRKGGAWLRRRKRYVDDGLIEESGGRWVATAAGVAAAGADIPDMPAPGLPLVKWWSERLDRAGGRALDLLAAVHPRTLTRDAIAAELGMSAAGGAFSRAIAALKSAELATETKKRLAIAGELMGDK